MLWGETSHDREKEIKEGTEWKNLEGNRVEGDEWEGWEGGWKEKKDDGNTVKKGNEI